MGEAEVGGGGAPGDKGPGEAATSPAEETVVWSPEVEVCLFHAMLGHKPVGKVILEEETKEEMKEDLDPHSGVDDVFSSGSLGKAAEKSSKDKGSELGCKDAADRRKRGRVTDKALTANSNPSSPSAAKRRRT
ncbi:MRG/MORF4L-binding protein isoform X2 [Ochotona curzoniae]|uniref:MRG/MORF4L-binding protein isoform X2 n=1 Tax=Ochotona curzoniae TaxID=130825 RepID=UPI001B3536B8|nr:MRG/MORF4L-binding protein isoform X2 [Ochotona curzoniae]